MTDSYNQNNINLGAASGVNDYQSFQQTAVAGLTSEYFIPRVPSLRLVFASFWSRTMAAPGESMIVRVFRWRLTAPGVLTTTTLNGTFTYDSSLPLGTEIDFSNLILPGITLEPGDIVSATRGYTAGGGPTPIEDTIVRFRLVPE